MEGALKHFNVAVEGRVALDAGLSTGGFTDCLLQVCHSECDTFVTLPCLPRLLSVTLL
jgi:hypothetical protein